MSRRVLGALNVCFLCGSRWGNGSTPFLGIVGGGGRFGVQNGTVYPRQKVNPSEVEASFRSVIEERYGRRCILVSDASGNGEGVWKHAKTIIVWRRSPLCRDEFEVSVNHLHPLYLRVVQYDGRERPARHDEPPLHQLSDQSHLGSCKIEAPLHAEQIQPAVHALAFKYAITSSRNRVSPSTRAGGSRLISPHRPAEQSNPSTTICFDTEPWARHHSNYESTDEVGLSCRAQNACAIEAPTMTCVRRPPPPEREHVQSVRVAIRDVSLYTSKMMDGAVAEDNASSPRSNCIESVGKGNPRDAAERWEFLGQRFRVSRIVKYPESLRY
ncbi:hypothetical protein C8R43DRAFT_1163445 [Mycena crocata]|nr:hypothetical protein C8R43DRAFT_1163445 [Mycena crocata]